MAGESVWAERRVWGGAEWQVGEHRGTETWRVRPVRQVPRPLLRVEWGPWRVLRKEATRSDNLRALLASRGWLGAETGSGGLRRLPRGWRGYTRGLRG